MAGNSLVASHAVICEKCGAKLRPGRDRCPRCRAFVSAPDPARAAADSRKLAKISAIMVAAFVLLLGGLWAWRETGAKGSPAKSIAPPSSPPPVSTTSADPNPPTAPLQQIGRDRPFLDAAAAGAAAYQGGDYATAVAQFEAAIEKNPQDTESLSNLGQVLIKMNRPADAIPFLSRAASMAPDRWTYQFNLARALGLVGRMDESIQGYRRAQELFPDDYVTTFNLALSLHKRGDDAGAVDQYQKAINLQPEDASFRKALAISYERLQKPADAAAAYQEYLRLSPAAADADKVRARIAELSGTPVPAAVPSSDAGRD
jgi:tetratricopeptide (TPR) repeat protein